jgi:hypothetical protein
MGRPVQPFKIYVAATLGLCLCLGGTAPAAWPLNLAQTQWVIDCSQEPGQTLIRLARDLIYQSQRDANNGQTARAAQLMQHALQLLPAVNDPFVRTDLVSSLVADYSPLEKLVDQAVLTRQPETVLTLLPGVVPVTQALEGEYGVINVKQSLLARLAHYYTVLGYPDLARPLLNEARQLLDRLHGDGFGLISAPVVQGYIALGDTQSAIALLDQSRQLTAAMTTQDEAYHDSIDATLAEGYAAAGALDTALQIAELLKAPAIQASTWVSIAAVMSASGQIDAARSLLARARAQALPDQSELLANIALGYAQANAPAQGLQLAEQIPSTQLKLRTLATLAAAYTAAQQPEAAAALLSRISAMAQEITPFYDGDALLRQVVTDYLAHQQYALAFQFAQTLDGLLQEESLLQLIDASTAAGEFDLALQAAETLPPGWQNQIRSLGLQRVATAYAQAGQYDQAIQLLPRIGEIADAPHQALTRLAIAAAYLQAGHPDPARVLLQQAHQSLVKLDNALPKLDALGLVAVQYALAGDLDQTMAVQMQILDMAKAFDSASTPVYVREQLVNQYLRANRYDLALRLVQSLPDNVEHDARLYPILNQWFETGDRLAAWQRVKEIREPSTQVTFLLKLADDFRATGDLEQASAILEQAFALTQTMAGPEEMVSNDPDMPYFSEFDRGSLTEAIAIGYAELGAHDQAEQTAQTLQSMAAREQLRQRLACYR